MEEHLQANRLDTLDKAILDVLQVNGRISNVDLARQVNLSPPATHTRVKRLEQQGYIDCYAAILNREQIGYDMLCFINVSLQTHQLEHIERFLAIVRAIPEVMECYHLTGEYDYLLKVVIQNRKDLQRFIVQNLTPIPGLAQIHTSLVLTEVKSKTDLPIKIKAE